VRACVRASVRQVRRERQKERERERRLEARDAHGGKRSKLTRDRDRDVSERIALGQVGAAFFLLFFNLGQVGAAFFA
jgi:hypothetical protein